MFHKYPSNNKKDDAYKIGQSLVVYEQNSALKRVQTGGDKQKFTISTWLKPAEHNSQTAYGDSIFTAGNEGSNGGRTDFFRILPTDVGGKHLRLYLAAPGAVAGDIQTKGAFNDQSAWIHAVAIIDSNNNNPLDRMQIWVNGLRQEVDISVQLTQGYSAMFFNNEGEQSLIANYAYFWQSSNTTSQPEQLRGYIAETYLIDGQALGSENFALTDDSGVYNPIPYTGTYGTNGFYLPFEASDIGADKSGNNNDFTPYGFNSDSVVADSPSNNYCTINPAASFVNSDCGGVLSDGNLNFYGYDGSGNGYPDTYGTFPFSSGKWYFEIDAKSLLSGAYFGMVDPSTIVDSTYPMNHVGCVSWNPAESGGFIRVDGVDTPYGVKASDGDILGIAIDVDGQTFEGFINGTGYGKFDISSAAVGSGLRVPMIVLFGDAGTGGEVLLNFGQRSWAHEPPSGYKALCTQNLPDTLVNPKENFSAVTYTGAGGTYSLTGVGFKPSLVWTKMRSGVERHNIADSVRGPNKSLTSHDTAAEMVDAGDGYFTSFDNDGWTGPGDKSATTGNNSTYVSWNFRGGDTEEYNYDGSVTSRVTANKDMGFSVIKWRPDGSPSTVGHGLGARPSLIIMKMLDEPSHWSTWADGVGIQNDNWLCLNTSDGIRSTSQGDYWDQSKTNSTVVGLGSNYNASNSASDLLMYCFTNTEMLQVGSYVGNGLEDGPFVSLPFKPTFVMVKGLISTVHWHMFDNGRYPSNPTVPITDYNSGIASNLSSIPAGEGAGPIDILSNGFKIKNSSGQVNNTNTKFLYLAISDQNFKHARGR